MVYNLSAISQNTTGLLSFTQAVNIVLLDGWLGTLFLIGITLVVLTSYIVVTNNTKKSVAATSFISLTLCLLLRAMSLVGDTVFFVTLILAGGALAIASRE